MLLNFLSTEIYDCKVNILNASFVMTLQFSAISSKLHPITLIFTGKLSLVSMRSI